ncbi:hypothetical protein TeGR_g13937 [Tetraparma gracilis]|uniref:Protein kinase domain-containing protein n=1 Tax=Tetraparma gracilis TaxID=2962635 RepID=A0ABQ6N9H8_9STRA|nr:hypothetical protein TeGR_g13937 [Tetraparma gracilis]
MGSTALEADTMCMDHVVCPPPGPSNRTFAPAHPTSFSRDLQPNVKNTWHFEAGVAECFTCPSSPPNALLRREILSVPSKDPIYRFVLIRFLAETVGGGKNSGCEAAGFDGGGVFLAARLTLTESDPDFPGQPVLVEATKEDRVIVKKSSLEAIKSLRERKELESPVTEISAAMYLQGGCFGTQLPSVVPEASVCPTICCFFETCAPNFLYNVMPLRGYDLLSVLTAQIEAHRAPFPAAVGLHVFKQILDLLGFLKEKEVCHRDITLENLLLDTATGKITLIDLGQTTWGRPVAGAGGADRLWVKHHRCGKKDYLAPEVWDRNRYCGFAVDLWQATVCLYTLVVGRYPYGEVPDASLSTEFHAIQCGKMDALIRHQHGGTGKFLPPPECLDFMQRSFRVDLEERVTLEAARNHEWVRNGASRPIPY